MFSIIPCESQINLFGLTHVSVLIISLILGFIIFKKNKEYKTIENIMHLIILVSHACLYVWYIVSPEIFIVKALPLYTCRLAIYLITIGVYFNKKYLLKMGVYWGFFGGIAGLLFPTIFDYPFPHILQITTFYLHAYLFLISTYYLFVKRIGMDKKDLKSCCKFTAGFLGSVTIVNLILGSNYSATLKMPGVLLKLGIYFPTSLCFLVVISGYLLAIVAEYGLVKLHERKSIEKASNN